MQQSTPADLPDLTSGVAALDVGYAHSCVVMDDGSAKCWGANDEGRIGDGTTGDVNAPVAVSGLTDASLIAAGRYSTCALRTTAGLTCWGDDAYGQLGDGGAVTGSGNSPTPTDVAGLTGLLRTAATWTTSSLSKGTHQMQAVYSGDAGHSNKATPVMTQTITGKPTTTTLTTSKTPTKVGESVTFTATASATDGTPTGSTMLSIDGADRTDMTLVSGSIGFVIPDLGVGIHSVAVRYLGDDTYAGSTSSTLSQTVERGDSTTGVTADATTIRAGGSAVFRAAIAAVDPSSGQSDGGQVVFRDGTNVLGTVTAAGGGAVLATNSLTVGTHVVTAAFQGTSQLNGSTSGTVTVTVDARYGAEFLVNARTAGSQEYPTVTARTGGGWVVAWASKDQDGSSWGIYAQRYNADGSANGGEFRVNTAKVGAQSFPAIAGTSDGGFVVTWLGTATTGKSTGIWARRWSAAGKALSGDVRVDTTAGTRQSAPSIAASATGGYLISWVSNNASGTTFDVHTQLYDRTARRVGGEVKANTVTMLTMTSASAVAELPGTGWVVGWTSFTKVGAKPIVKAQRLTAKGVRAGAEIAVTSATWAQSEPVVASLKGEGFVVVWVSQGQDGSGKGLYAQRYSTAGARLGAAFRVNATTAGDQSEPSAVSRRGNGFLVVWTSPDASGKGVYCRLYGANGVPFDAVFPVNSSTANHQWQPAVSMRSASSFVVVWTSLATDGGAEGVYGQRFDFVAEE